MASATRSHSQRTSGYGIDIFKPVLNTKNELLELIQQIETQNKPLVTELRTKIYQAMKPTTADVQDDINTGLDEVEAWFRQLRKLLEDLASQEERRNKLKERLRRQAEESLDLAAQVITYMTAF